MKNVLMGLAITTSITSCGYSNSASKSSTKSLPGPVEAMSGRTKNANESEMPPNREESAAAFLNFKIAVSKRFGLPLQEVGLPKAKISSGNCEIQIVDTSRIGDAVLIEITDRETAAWILGTYPEASARFLQNNGAFTYKTYKQDCGEMGCDGLWYIDRALSIYENILVVSSTSPYSHKMTTTHCSLVPR
jgi:hypothetical protein